MADEWSFCEPSFDPAAALAYEGLFTLGSGYLHVRGSLEEGLSDKPQNLAFTRVPANVTNEKFRETKAKWGTYVPGVFGSHPLLNREMVNLPWFLDLAPEVDGEKLDVERGRVEACRRELRMREATLWRRLRWHTKSGATLEVTFERFVSAARPHLAVQRLTLRADRDSSVTVRAGIDADVRTNGYDHLTAVEFEQSGGDGVHCRVETDGGSEVRMLARLRAPGAAWSYRAAGRAARLSAEIALPAGTDVVVEKRTAVTTSRDRDGSAAAGVLDGASGLSYEEFHEEHAAIWNERWDRSDVIVEGTPMAARLHAVHRSRGRGPGLGAGHPVGRVYPRRTFSAGLQQSAGAAVDLEGLYGGPAL
jgi:trehalose/maltose hydrolase-like predicted phosphorylase